MGKLISLQAFSERRKTNRDKSFQLVLMPGELQNHNGLDYYVKAYELWHLVWSKTLKELDGVPNLYSDQFTRQNLIASIFYEGQCVALTCFRKANLCNPVAYKDSWFIPWGDTLLIELSKHYPETMSNSFFTLHPDFRRSNKDTNLNIDLSILLTEVVAYISAKIGVDAVFGVTRNERSVNKLAYYGGATSIAKDRTHHGVAVDLIAFFPEPTARAMVHFSKAIEPLWNSKISFLPWAFHGEEKIYAKDIRSSY